ncbi:DUF397 domain-containing protein [Nocardia uniformis]|uniref:DUF397 domain-containing protein n=1 Tax=Nocardia uniformis TaxID=53432 RepID=A0A849BWT6_9NOCA|nr:DUF397 domain-containing protein [Nocardia uniformis]NNH71022.1 DUF397 domain-containing protein [Nocardia uniformis]
MSTNFYKSTFSGGDQTCVEVAHTSGAVLIRDSKYNGPANEQPIISIPTLLWPPLLDLALSNESGAVGNATITVHSDASATVAAQGIALVYNADEWDAFMKGIANGEFYRRS